MRPARQVKIISSQLENLEFLKKQLEDLIVEIEKIMTQGRTWIDETDTIQSFTQMTQFLTSETVKCTQKCLDIADEEKDTSQISSTTEGNMSGSLCIYTPSNLNDSFKENVMIKMVEIDKWMTKHSTKLTDIKQKLKLQEKQNKIISTQWAEKDKKIEVKFEEIMKELHSASDFMSTLHSQTEMLTDFKHEHENMLDKLILEHKVQELNISDRNKNRRSNMAELQAVTGDLGKDVNSLNVPVQPPMKDIETVSSDLVSFKTSNDPMIKAYKDNNNVFQNSSTLDVLTKDITYSKNLNASGKKVAFTVGLTETTLVPIDSVVKYDKIITNIGDCYNSDTGIFTCPMDGLYLFYVRLMTKGNTMAFMELYQNTEIIVSLSSPYENEAGINSNLVTIHLKKCDEVFLKCLFVEESYLFGNSSATYNTFTGIMLSAD